MYETTQRNFKIGYESHYRFMLMIICQLIYSFIKSGSLTEVELNKSNFFSITALIRHTELHMCISMVSKISNTGFVKITSQIRLIVISILED